MATYAQVAAKLLRHAAQYFRQVGDETPAVTDKMTTNAATYDQVADLLENDPMGGTPDGDQEDRAL